MSQISIRAFEPGDRAFVLDSFWRSVREHPGAEDCAPALLAGLLEPMLARWVTLVACPVDEPKVILGWLCAREPSTVAWGFVKPYARGKGVMRALAAHAGIERQFSIAFPPAIRFERWRPRWRPYLAVEVSS